MIIMLVYSFCFVFFFFQAEDGIRDLIVTGVQTCALPISEAINHSLSGPMLRASGVPYDVRKDKPYLDYETYDFDVVVGEHGDVYDRYLVDRKSTRLNSSHDQISYAVFCLKKKKF